VSGASRVPDEQYPLGVRPDVDEPSVFDPASLLAASRRQRGLPALGVPAVCVLDPDGDLAAQAAAACGGAAFPGWACYHTRMYLLETAGGPVGVVGHAVGAPFAVLVAEQLAVSGAELVISVSSAGGLGGLPAANRVGIEPGGLVLIDRAVRDEGTSGHYLPPGQWSVLSPLLRQSLVGAFDDLPFAVGVGSSWTTDAPYRETPTEIAAAAAAGAMCVEMEAAGLYAYAAARGRAVVCLAQVTNEPGREGEDFEKGPRHGVEQALAVIEAVIRALRGLPTERPSTANVRGAPGG